MSQHCVIFFTCLKIIQCLFPLNLFSMCVHFNLDVNINHNNKNTCSEEDNPSNKSTGRNRRRGMGRGREIAQLPWQPLDWASWTKLVRVREGGWGALRKAWLCNRRRWRESQQRNGAWKIPSVQSSWLWETFRFVPFLFLFSTWACVWSEQIGEH